LLTLRKTENKLEILSKYQSFIIVKDEH